jgi:hypothetical protein
VYYTRIIIFAETRTLKTANGALKEADLQAIGAPLQRN